MIPTPKGPANISALVGLLCYGDLSLKEVMSSEIGYLLGPEQQTLLEDRLCQSTPKESKLEALVKTLHVLKAANRPVTLL